MNLDISCKLRKKWSIKSIQISDINNFSNNNKVENPNIEKLLRKLAIFKGEKISKVERENYRGFFISLGDKPNLIMINNNLKSIRIYAQSVRDLKNTLRIFLNSLQDIKIKIKRLRKDEIILSDYDIFETYELRKTISNIFLGGFIAQLILVGADLFFRPNYIYFDLIAASFFLILVIIFYRKKSNEFGLKYAT